MSTHREHNAHCLHARSAVPILLLPSAGSSAGSTGPVSRGISAPLLHPEKEELCLNQGIGVKHERAQQALPPNVSPNSHFCLPNTANISQLSPWDPGSPELRFSPVPPQCLDSKSRSSPCAPRPPFISPTELFQC